jgi:hypothetical protein
MQSKTHQDLQPKLTRWLVSGEDQSWLSTEDITSSAMALNAYDAAHPSPEHVGEATLRVGGQTIQTGHAKIEDQLIAQIPNHLLSGGSNTVEIDRQGAGEAFYQIDSRVVLPLKNESDEGIRVVRKYEVQNSAGMWEELHRDVKAGESVRSTVLIWGDEVPDVVKLTDPLPAGFDFVDEDDSGANAQTDVRDAAVIHYVQTGGAPVFFRFYMRAESDGKLAALPATAEVLRVPSKRGQTAEDQITVVKP